MVSQYPLLVSKIITDSGIEVAQQEKCVGRGSGFHNAIKVVVKAVLNLIDAHQKRCIGTEDCDMLSRVEFLTCGKKNLHTFIRHHTHL